MAFRRISSIVVLALAIASLLWVFAERQPKRAQVGRQAPAQRSFLTVIPVGKPVPIRTPLGLPPVPVPKGNPPTVETIALGRKLYDDPILSADKLCRLRHLPQSEVRIHGW